MQHVVEGHVAWWKDVQRVVEGRVACGGKTCSMWWKDMQRVVEGRVA